MPGVPSGLGCDACRKAKKKCDLTKPSCQNCIRRGIPCVGVGVKRWKFMASEPSSSSSASSSLSFSASSSSSSASSSSSSSSPPPPVVVRYRPGYPLNNETTRLAASLAYVIGSQDIKYDTRSFGGDFLADLPRRVGCNPLLDAAVSAAVASYHAVVHRTAIPSSSQDLQQKAFIRYGAALEALRRAMETIDHDAPLAIAHRMYAIVLISYCQDWIDPVNKDTAPHREMLAHLLQHALRVGRISEIGKVYLYPLCQTLVWEAWVNPRLNIEKWLWVLLDAAFAGARPHKYCNQQTYLPFITLEIEHQARTAVFLRDPERHMGQLRRIHLTGRAERAQMRALLAQMTAAEVEAGRMAASGEVLRTHRTRRVAAQVGLGLMIFLGSGVNRGMQPFAESNPDLDLAEDMHAMVDDAIQMARLCADLRPFGSMFVPKVLKVVWACLPDDDRYGRVDLEAWLRFFERDFEGADYVDSARELRERLDVASGRSNAQGGFTEGIYSRALEVRTGSW